MSLLELLNFFSIISGLKINKAKCSLVRINSNERKIERLAQSWGCEFRRNLNDLETLEYTSLSAKLDSARFYVTRGDARRWSSERDGSCSCKSFISFYENNPDFSDFDPVDQIWKAKVPSKVHILAWLVAHGKVNICNIQKQRPSHFLNPQWCIVYTLQGQGREC